LKPANPTIIDLWPEGVPGLLADASPEKTKPNGSVFNIHYPSLTVCLPEPGAANGTAVIICPGGGYQNVSLEHEGYVTSHWLNRLGVTAFVLKYRMKEYGQPAHLQDILRAVRTVRSRASEFGLRTDRIGVLGFSAGGNLAATAGTMFDAPEGRTGAPLDSVSGRPDFMILVYPVITMEEPFVHWDSRNALIGPNPTGDHIKRWSLEQQVTNASPPAFLLATQVDQPVPVENSLRFYEALHAAGVPTELHIYHNGEHGFGLKPGNGPTSEWPERVEDWMRYNGWLPAQK
jgi:acetyl esterase/lipase